MIRLAIVSMGIAAPLALAACGQPPSAPTNTTASADVDYVNRIRTMPEGQRTAVFLRAIRDAGRECQEVTEATEVTGQGGPATWAATCDDGGRWIVAIAADGTARVTNQTALQGAAKG